MQLGSIFYVNLDFSPIIQVDLGLKLQYGRAKRLVIGNLLA